MWVLKTLGIRHREFWEMPERERAEWLEYAAFRERRKDELLNVLRTEDGKLSEFTAGAYVTLMLEGL